MTDGDIKFMHEGSEYVMSVANGVILVDEFQDDAYANCFTGQLKDPEHNPRIEWDDPQPPDEVKREARARWLG